MIWDVAEVERPRVINRDVKEIMIEFEVMVFTFAIRVNPLCRHIFPSTS